MIDPKEYDAEAIRLVQSGKAQGLTLRVMGGVAVRIHCPKYETILSLMKRRANDVDLVGRRRERHGVITLFTNLGYGFDRQMQILMERCIFEDKSCGLSVDVFFDKIRMCFEVDLTRRLAIDSPTISLADLLLQKMQIVHLNEKDIQDTMVLLREHAVGAEDNETINSNYIADVLSRNWGFYYTVTSNLEKVLTFLPKYEALEEGDRSDIRSRIGELLKEIKGKPKSPKWRLRGKIGTRIKWYEEVEEVTASRVYTKDIQ